MNRTTIFKQLILNVITPVVIALVGLAIINYFNTKSMLVQRDNMQNASISDEISYLLQFQDVPLKLVEEQLDVKLREYSEKLVNEVFLNTDGIEKANLDSIQLALGMDPNQEDIYVINGNGDVVNTTFEKDLGRNFFAFGDIFKNFLLGVLKTNEFTSEKFSIEMTTQKLRKYTYQSTKDRKYIIEIGNYSRKANEIMSEVKNRLNAIAETQIGIQSVDLFIGADQPFSLNSGEMVETEQLEIMKNMFAEKQEAPYSIDKTEKGQELNYQYKYMEREGTELYKGGVIRIVSDRSEEAAMLRNELIISLSFFVGMLIVIMITIYNKTKVITSPIKKLVDNVNRITEGHLNERADVEGNNEIASLSEKFNSMLEELEGYYNELEKKVAERTAEVVAQKEEIELQANSLAEKNKEIMDSIHYAKRIQNAILPADKMVRKSLPDSFILYKPKDIVSGDFYWMNVKENKVMIAAVDCTGHGVPGAFMSIVGHNQLNYAVNVAGHTNPAEILNALNIGVTNALRQRETENPVRDGMDIALCTVDYENNLLQYAGAFNPLYKLANGEIEQVTGDKHPIGAFVGEELKKFKSHDIEMKKGETYYIFSDGYADQFGGPKGKKFKYKHFRELLVSIADKPMKEQRGILDTEIEEWRGELEQVDDILVIGIRA